MYEKTLCSILLQEFIPSLQMSGFPVTVFKRTANFRGKETWFANRGTEHTDGNE